MPNYLVIVTITADDVDKAQLVADEISGGLQDADDSGQLADFTSWAVGPLMVTCQPL